MDSHVCRTPDLCLGPEAGFGGNVDVLHHYDRELMAAAGRGVPQVFDGPQNCDPMEDFVAAGYEYFRGYSGDSLPEFAENVISPSSQHGTQEIDLYSASDSDDGYSFVDGGDESDDDLLSLKDFVSEETHQQLKPESTDHIFHDAEMIDADEGKT